MTGNRPTTSCDLPGLEALLNGGLNTAEETAILAHLDHCEQCREILESQAADPSMWSEIQQLLRSGTDASSATADDDPESGRLPPQIQAVVDALGPTDDPRMLGRLGGYEVSAVIGAGGMGVVLKAIDKSLDRTIAIKVLAPHLASSGAARKRFSREAKAAAAVLHPNVIAIHSVSNDDTWPFLVMPYLRGESLQKRIDREGPLALAEVLRIGAQIAAGLAAAHAQGLVHRDIKPANILLEDGVERVTITDFGLARAVDDASLTYSGVIAGTPQYMSPEQARGDAVDQRSDLFSLGSVLYTLCTGRPPFRAENSYGILRRITDDQPTAIREINPEVPEWLCQVIGRLMCKPAVDRYESADQVAELLEGCLAHVQHPTASPLPASLTARSAHRRLSFPSPRTGVAVMFAMFGLVLTCLMLWLTDKPQPAPNSENPAGTATQQSPSKAATPAGVTFPIEFYLAQTKPGEGLTEHTLNEGRQKLYVADKPFATNADLLSVNISDDANDTKSIELQFQEAAVERLGDITEKHVDQPVAVFINRQLLIAPVVRQRFSSKMVLTFGRTDAERVIQALSGAPHRLHQFPQDEVVESLACSPDGKRIALILGGSSLPIVPDWKRTVKILDGETGRTIVSLPLWTADEETTLADIEGLPHFPAGPLTFSPDGTMLAVGTGLGQVKLFEATTGKLIRALDDAEGKAADRTTPAKFQTIARALGEVQALAFSPDGTLLATSGSSFDDRARNWGDIRRLGRLSSGPGRLKIWNTETGKLQRDLAGFSHAGEVAFSSDGSLLACAGQWVGESDNGTGVIVWNPHTGEKLRTIALNANGGTWWLEFAPHQKLLIIGSRQFDKENDTSSSTMTLAYALSGITEWKRTIPGSAIPAGFTPDGKSVVILSEGKTIQWWDTETAATRQELRPSDADPKGRINQISLIKSGLGLVVGGMSNHHKGLLEVWKSNGVAGAESSVPNAKREEM